MADDSQPLPTDFDERFSDVYNRFTVPGQDTPLYTPKSSIIDFKKPTVKERFGGLPTEGPPEAFYTQPIERGKGGTLVEVPKKLREGNYELTPVEGNIAPGSLREVLFGYDKPVGRYQSWPERLARIVGKGAFNIVEAIPGGVMAPYEAYKGRLQVTDPATGMPTEEAIQRSIAALSLPGGAGVIGGAEKGVVGAGPYRRNTNYIQEQSAIKNLVDKYQDKGVTLDISGPEFHNDPSPYMLHWIESKGLEPKAGTKAIRELSELADKNGKEIHLVALGDNQPGGKYLEKYYKALGFKPTGEITPDGIVMVREPNAQISRKMTAKLRSDTSKPASYLSGFLPNGVPKPEAFDRVLPAVRNLETGKISTTKRGNEHSDILTKLWEREGGSPNADTMSIYDDMLPRHEMGFYDPKNKQFFSRSHPDWENIDSPDLNPRQAMRADQVFSDTSKSGMVLNALMQNARNHFGITNNPKEAGYILPNGEMLDFSGRHYGTGYEKVNGRNVPKQGQPDYLAGHRNVDHREVQDLLAEHNPDYEGAFTNNDAMKYLMNGGAIRNQPGFGFDTTVIPTDKQLTRIVSSHNSHFKGEPLQVDITSPETGENLATTRFDKPTIENVKKFIYKETSKYPTLFSDTSKQAQLLSSLTASQRKAYNREAFRNGGQMLVPEASEEAIRKLVEEPAYKKWEKVANDAGFTTDAYHGTSNFEGSTIEPKRAGKTEFYSTDEPKLAEDYSGKSGGILPLKLNTSNYHVIDAHGKTWDQINEQVIKTAKEQGNSGVTIKNLRDSAADREVEPATVHITFDPSTVRSRFAKFNPEDVKKNGLLLSETSKPAAMLAPAFHSAVENAVNNAKIKTGTPEQWLGYLKNQQGVKQEELDWIRPQDVPTNEKGQVSKEAMQDYVNSHKVELKEVNKGGHTNWTQKDSERLDELEQLGHRITDEEEAERQALITRENAATSEEGHSGQPERLTKYSQYQLSGGENYREKLLTLPEKLKEDQGWNIKGQSISQLIHDPEKNYQSSHWDEPNVLAHIRMNDRNIPGVGKSLHLEEIQSDWHQAGREKGYDIKVDPSNYVIEGNGPWVIRNKETGDFVHDFNNKQHAEGYLKDIQKGLILPWRKEGLVPNAPFKKTWSDLALKRMIREASEKGYDAVSWTPGEAQAERYDLSKHVEQISFNPVNGMLKAYKKGGNGEKVIDEKIKPNELASYVGKEAADKLINNPTRTYDQVDGKYHILEGEGLKVGGEGMKAFYDKMLVDKMNNLAKKYGGKVEQSNIETPGKYKFNVYDENNNLMKTFDDRIDAQKFVTKPNSTEWKNRNWSIKEEMVKGKEAVHVLKLPQSMKDAALQKGFPLFSKTGHILTPTSNPYINNENDVPYGAGASDTSTGYPVHVDKRIPEMDPKLTLPSGEPANLHSYLQVHEITEHQLMKRGMSYEQAHKRATEREKAAVERDGVSWDEYSHIMSGYLKETEKEKVDNPPPNLYKRPYAHDRKELKKLEK